MLGGTHDLARRTGCSTSCGRWRRHTPRLPRSASSWPGAWSTAERCQGRAGPGAPRRAARRAAGTCRGYPQDEWVERFRSARAAVGPRVEFRARPTPPGPLRVPAADPSVRAGRMECCTLGSERHLDGHGFVTFRSSAMCFDVIGKKRDDDCPAIKIYSMVARIIAEFLHQPGLIPHPSAEICAPQDKKDTVTSHLRTGRSHFRDLPMSTPATDRSHGRISASASGRGVVPALDLD